MEPALIGVSQSIKDIRSFINQGIDTQSNMLILGERGVGKECVAQALYHNSGKEGKPFIKVDCAALAAVLAAGQRSKYRQNAFNAVCWKKEGLFQTGKTGVLLLDGIGGIPLSIQAKFIEVLQERETAPFDHESTAATGMWIIATTERDLDQDIKDGKFRDDLYDPLNLKKIFIPPLRKRPEDIFPLIHYYLGKYASRFARERLLKLNGRIMDKMMAYHWPGNIRELQHVLNYSIFKGEWIALGKNN
jgi:transcriptional regulator with GAF, ATPase, and Fis domain